MHFSAQRVSKDRFAAHEHSAFMAIPVPRPFRGALRLGRLAALPIVGMAIMLGGCSVNLGSLSPGGESEPPKPAPAQPSVTDAQPHAARGQALARSGKTEEARSEFDQAIAIDPNNAQALYGR